MFYHDIFGFDVFIWSPPHLMAVFGGVVSSLGVPQIWLYHKRSTSSLFGVYICHRSRVIFGQLSLSEYFGEGTLSPSRFCNVTCLLCVRRPIIPKTVFGKSLINRYFSVELHKHSYTSGVNEGNRVEQLLRYRG